MFDWIKKLYELYREWRESRKEPPEPQPEPEPEPQPPPPPEPMPDANRPDRYRRGFLWKPIADGGRPLVVLLPRDFTDNTTKVLEMHKDGRVLERSGIERNRRDTGLYPNGNREHYRFDRRGESYPAPVEIVAETTNGVKWVWTIANTAARNDSNITPTTR